MEATTGEVHTVPGRFVVHRSARRYRPGDVLQLLTYLGEGHFKVYFAGEVFVEGLGFSPWGGCPDARCSDHPECFGVLEKTLEFTWWALVSFGETQGWVEVGDRFDDIDACGRAAQAEE